MAHSGSLDITQKLREQADLIVSLCDASKCAASIKDKSTELGRIIENTNDLEKRLNNIKLQDDQLLQDLKQHQDDLNIALRNTVEIFPQLEVSVNTLCRDVSEFMALIKRFFDEVKKSGVILDTSEIRRSVRKINECAKAFAVNCKELCERQQKAQVLANEFAEKIRKKAEDLLAARTPKARLALDALKSIGLILSGAGILIVGRVTKVQKLSEFGAGLALDGVAEGESTIDKVDRNMELSNLAKALILEASKMDTIATSLIDNEDRLAVLIKSNNDSTEAWEIALKLLDKTLRTQDEYSVLQLVVGDKDAQIAQKDSQIASLIEVMKLHGIAIPSSLQS